MCAGKVLKNQYIIKRCSIIKRNSKRYTFLNSFLLSKTCLFYTIVGRKSRIISIFFVDSDGIPKKDP